MALFQATNITPDLKGGAKNGVVFSGIGAEVDVSWQVNGNSPMLAYRIQFFRNDAASTPGTDTGKIVLDEPFYPVSGDGTQNRFSVTLPYGIGGTYFSIAALDENRQGKLIITQWWGSTDAQSVVQRSASVFRVTRPTTATISGPTYANGQYSFDASVELPSYVVNGESAVLWHQWSIIRIDELAYPITYTEVQTSGKIWGAAVYDWTANLLPQGEYFARFRFETSNGETITLDSDIFQALSDEVLIDMSEIATVACNRQKGAVHIDCETIIQQEIPGDTASLTYGETGGYPATWHFTSQNKGHAEWEIPHVASGVWGFSWRGYVSEYKPTLLRVTLKNNSVVSFGLAQGENPDVPILSPSVAITPPDHFDLGNAEMIQFSFWLDGTNANWALTVYQDDSPYDWTSAASTPFALSEPVKLEMYYGLMTDRLYIAYGETGIDTIQTAVSAQYVNDWGCPLISLPQSAAYANLSFMPFGQDFLDGQAPIIREDAESGEYTVIGAYENLFDGTGNFYDYAALNGHSYNYYVAYQLGQSTETVMVKIGSAAPCFWNWLLIEAQQNGQNKAWYEVRQVFCFEGNVSSGSYTNRGTRNIQPTFTPYPAVFRSAQNSRQGTLTGLIGRVTGGVYYDSNETEAALRALSSSRNQLFLRDRRGNLIRFALAGEISMSVNDGTAKQEITASVPWVETGPTDGISVCERFAELP